MRTVWGARFRADHGHSGSYAFGSVLRNALVFTDFQWGTFHLDEESAYWTSGLP
jgi:hypothetical protein